MTKAILFDVDGVLLDSFEANLKFFQNLMKKAGYPGPTREEYHSLFYLPMIEVIRRLAPGQDEQEIQRIFALGSDRGNLYPLELLRVPKDAEKVLEVLQKKYSLGLVTSRIKTAIFSIPQLAEFQRFFQVVVGFEDTEKHKPDPDPLIFAAQQLNVLPEETVYIGDAETDFQAARAAGMKIIMYKNSTVQDADGYVNGFEELKKI